MCSTALATSRTRADVAMDPTPPGLGPCVGFGKCPDRKECPARMGTVGDQTAVIQHAQLLRLVPTVPGAGHIDESPRCTTRRS